MIYTLDQCEDHLDMVNKVICCDALELLKKLPDNSIDLCLCDPPYGIGYDKALHTRNKVQYGKACAAKKQYKATEWDNEKPKAVIFDEIIRVSRNQIIFGGEHLSFMLPPSRGWIVWDKKTGSNNFSDCELAYTSYDQPLKKIEFMWNGMLQENMKNKEERFHPTQKPRELMSRIISDYAPEANVILDPFGGSFTTMKACQELGIDCISCDLEYEYCLIGEQRLAEQPLFTV